MDGGGGDCADEAAFKEDDARAEQARRIRLALCAREPAIATRVGSLYRMVENEGDAAPALFLCFGLVAHDTASGAYN